ncbi:MAG TPA: hypothetical protein VKB60_01570 [Terriglobales bacterium]|nr:hypothetical protein [Terriglobales bacterium]
MRFQLAQENCLRLKVNFCVKPVIVSLDVEYRYAFDAVSIAKRLSQLCQVPPARLRHNGEPARQRRLKVTVVFHSLVEHFTV